MNRTCSIPLAAEHEQAVLRVLRRGILVAGPETDALEEEFATWLGVDRDLVVAVNSGTAALTALLIANGIGYGDEVLVPGYTFTATALAVLRAGAKPVLIDVNSTWTMDPGAIRPSLSNATQALIGVDLDGAPADWTRLENAARGLGLKLIEDACPAFGARYGGRAAGTLGRDGAAFSMNESKQLPAGEGGFVVAPSPAIANRVRRMRHFGHPVDDHIGDRSGAVELSGDNWKITETAAAIARASLPGLTERVMNSRLVGKIIRDALAECPTLAPPPLVPNAEPSWYRLRAMAIDVDQRQEIARRLQAGGVPLTGREEVVPLEFHPMFRGCSRGTLENARQAQRSFCIGSRQQQVFAADPAEAERWGEVITSLPS